MPKAIAKPGFLKGVQLLISFASVCAVVEASRVDSPPPQRPGYSATVPLGREPSGDRRIGDLARVDRQRREAAQQASRQRLALGQVLEHRQVRV